MILELSGYEHPAVLEALAQNLLRLREVNDQIPRSPYSSHRHGQRGPIPAEPSELSNRRRMIAFTARQSMLRSLSSGVGLTENVRNHRGPS